LQVAANAQEQLNASPATGFLVGGISSGANFAGVIAYIIWDAGLTPPITGLFISIPVCVMPQDYHLLPHEQTDQLLSLAQNAENPMLTRKSLTDIQGQQLCCLKDTIALILLILLIRRNACVELYGSPPADPRVSFLLNETHSNLPSRAYFQICGGDVLRDEAFLWQKLLRKHSGTISKTHLYSGMPHGFWGFLQMKASQEWLEDLVEGIRSLCDVEKEVGEKDEVIVRGV